jgi:ribonuclease HI
MKHETITIFSDGSSRGNPGPGGWAAVIAMPAEKRVVELGGREDRTTNNRMELTGALNALLHIKHLEDDVVVHTDSSYLIQGITKWVKGWIKNGWTTQNREEVINRDLWELLTAVLEQREEKGSTTSWKHVSGHAGIPGNERCDEIATMFADGKEVELYNGSLEEYEYDLLTATPNREKKEVKTAKKSRSSKPAYSYVSMIDGNIETYKTWAECEAKVKGTKGAKYKKALSKEEEAEIIEEWSKKE